VQRIESALTLEFLRPDGLSLETPFGWGIMTDGQERRGAMLRQLTAEPRNPTSPSTMTSPARRRSPCRSGAALRPGEVAYGAGAAKLTSAVSTVPARRPGAAWKSQYRLVCVITCSGGGAPH
jgi:hypothetical protein